MEWKRKTILLNLYYSVENSLTPFQWIRESRNNHLSKGVQRNSVDETESAVLSGRRKIEGASF